MIGLARSKRSEEIAESIVSALGRDEKAKDRLRSWTQKWYRLPLGATTAYDLTLDGFLTPLPAVFDSSPGQAAALDAIPYRGFLLDCVPLVVRPGAKALTGSSPIYALSKVPEDRAIPMRTNPGLELELAFRVDPALGDSNSTLAKHAATDRVVPITSCRVLVVDKASGKIAFEAASP